MPFIRHLNLKFKKNVRMVKVLQYFTQMYNTYTYLIKDYD
jgi:hypothetical protein